ncbi:MAG TPA: hypothetical protein VFG05_13615 [Methylocella sp.]|nr:hypothetical protein [Methylocella sp.]
MLRDGFPDLTVVKLGGSLALSPERAAWLDALTATGGALILVPGGGLFADCVRSSQEVMGFGDVAAHRMALLAMAQAGIALAAHSQIFVLAETEEDFALALRSGRVPVWLPEKMALGAADVPPCWEVTSDSLAAWLAGICGARRLLLIKSCDVEDGVSLHELAARKTVDALFPRFALLSQAGVWIAGPASLKTAALILQKGAMPGRLIAVS